jgi:hypothetical protein
MNSSSVVCIERGMMFADPFKQVVTYMNKKVHGTAFA